MSAELNMAKLRLFDKDGLNVQNIKFFMGSSKDVTPEQIAEEINKSLFELEAEAIEAVDGKE